MVEIYQVWQITPSFININIAPRKSLTVNMSISKVGNIFLISNINIVIILTSFLQKTKLFIFDWSSDITVHPCSISAVLLIRYTQPEHSNQHFYCATGQQSRFKQHFLFSNARLYQQGCFTFFEYWCCAKYVQNQGVCRKYYKKQNDNRMTKSKTISFYFWETFLTQNKTLLTFIFRKYLRLIQPM